jgi:hypothetical protein
VVRLNGNLPDTTAESEPDLVVASVVDACVQPGDRGFLGHGGELIVFGGEES